MLTDALLCTWPEILLLKRRGIDFVGQLQVSRSVDFRRWNVELDLRSLKTVIQMEMLRCKTRELVRKEIWTHIMAYKLICTVMAQAATKQYVHPRSISFQGTIQILEAFQ